VGNTTVVAAWHHAEMGDECLETLRQIVGVWLGQVAECRRKAVAAVLLRHTAKQAQGVLQAARQSRVALAAEHDLDMLEAGTGQCEMIQPMFEAPATDDDAEFADIGEIGQAHAAGLPHLAKHDVPVGAMQGFPFRHAPLQRAPERGPDTIGMAPRQFIEQADRAQTRGGLQQRDDLLVPHVSQRIGPRAIDPPLLLGARRAWITIDALAGRERQAGFGCGGDLRVVGA
jgi:hypothetical protein